MPTRKALTPTAFSFEGVIGSREELSPSNEEAVSGNHLSLFFYPEPLPPGLPPPPCQIASGRGAMSQGLNESRSFSEWKGKPPQNEAVPKIFVKKSTRARSLRKSRVLHLNHLLNIVKSVIYKNICIYICVKI